MKVVRRVTVALTMSIVVALLMIPAWRSSTSSLFLRAIIVGLSATMAFTLFEVWPRRLPRWLQRWALQVIAVGLFMPATTVLLEMLSPLQGVAPFWMSIGWTHATFIALFLAPWTAFVAIVRQKDALARDQEAVSYTHLTLPTILRV